MFEQIYSTFCRGQRLVVVKQSFTCFVEPYLVQLNSLSARKAVSWLFVKYILLVILWLIPEYFHTHREDDLMTSSTVISRHSTTLYHITMSLPHKRSQQRRNTKWSCHLHQAFSKPQLWQNMYVLSTNLPDLVNKNTPLL